MLESVEGQSEAGGLVVLREETQDRILELNPKYGYQRERETQAFDLLYRVFFFFFFVSLYEDF